jgi:hypothetical protein
MFLLLYPLPYAPCEPMRGYTMVDGVRSGSVVEELATTLPSYAHYSNPNDNHIFDAPGLTFSENEYTQRRYIPRLAKFTFSYTRIRFYTQDACWEDRRIPEQCDSDTNVRSVLGMQGFMHRRIIACT